MYCIYVRSIWLQVQDPFVFRPLRISACALGAEREPCRGERVGRGERAAWRELVARAAVLRGQQAFGSPGGVPAPGRGRRAASRAAAAEPVGSGVEFCLTRALPAAEQTLCFGSGVCDVPWEGQAGPQRHAKAAPNLPLEHL